MSQSSLAIHANPTATPHALFAAFAFVIIMVVGVWQMVAAMTNPDGLTYPRTWLDFREGRSTQTLEKQLDHKLPIRSSLIATANSIRYLLTGAGGDQVRVGQDDWLFLTEELRYDANGTAPLQARAALLGEAARRLERQGVKLVVALVPDKARIYASNLPGGEYPPYNAPRYADTLVAFKGQGVTAVDVLTPLTQAATQGDVYYRADTHWNQVGARVTAQAIASTVGTLKLDLEASSFSTTTSGAPTERPGDLVRLMGLEGLPAALRPAQDTEANAETRMTSTQAGGGLFGDASVPVVLTGSSYSLRGNFHGYLQEALGAKVLNAAKDGGGFLTATGDYLGDEAFRSSKPKLLLWEIPERFMWMALTAEPTWLAKVGLAPY